MALRALTGAALVLVATTTLACSSVVGGSGGGLAATGGATLPSVSAQPSTGGVTASSTSASSPASAPASASASAPASASRAVVVPSPSPLMPIPSASASSPTPTVNVLTCPQVTYLAAHLRYACVTAGMTAFKDPIWTTAVVKPVENDRWAAEEGAKHVGSPGSQSLAAIATGVRTQMVKAGAYGTPDPQVKTISGAQGELDGVLAYELQSQFTISPTYRSEHHLTLKVERSWIVVFQVAPGNVSVWYVSIPDDLSSLWAAVPALISNITIF